MKSDNHSLLPEGWVRCRLREVVSHRKGKKPKNLYNEPVEGAKPYITIEAFESGRPVQFTTADDVVPCTKGDLLVVWDGARSGLAGRNMTGAAGSTLMVLQTLEMEKDYLFWFITKNFELINSNPRGSGLPHVEPELFWNLEAPLSPLPEQRLIVARVETLLEHVRKAKEALGEVLKIIKRFRQAVLKKAFSGELTAEWRAQQHHLEPATELLKRIQEERRKRYEEEVKKAKAEGRRPPKQPKYLNVAQAKSLHNDLPEGWVWCRLEEVAQINPCHPPNILPEDAEVTFVPMSGINENSWKFKEMQIRTFGEVRKGYTHFAEGDVLFAKITPCMENGKAAIARNLINAIGCGTTELHVIRPEGHIPPEFIYYYIHQESFRKKAEAHMTGTAGQLRVPVNFVNSASISLSPLPEQHEIVRRVEALFGFADGMERRVDEARKLVEKISQSVLAKAFRGELTADFRDAIKGWKNLGLEERRKYIFTLPEDDQEKTLYGDEFPFEPAEWLLERIRKEHTKRELEGKRTKEKRRTLFTTNFVGVSFGS